MHATVHMISTPSTLLSPVDHAGPVKKLPIKGVGAFALSPTTPLIAVYVPEIKASPAFVGLYDYSGLTNSSDAPPPICRKSFFRVSSSICWGGRYA